MIYKYKGEYFCKINEIQEDMSVAILLARHVKRLEKRGQKYVRIPKAQLLEKQKKEAMDLDNKECRICEGLFQSKFATKVCSQKCRDILKKQQIERHSKECHCCGGLFLGHGNAKCCGMVCKGALYIYQREILNNKEGKSDEEIRKKVMDAFGVKRK